MSQVHGDALSDLFMPELEVSLDWYPPSDVDASKRAHRTDEFFVAYLETRFTPGQLHMLSRLVGYYQAAVGREAEFWRELMLFYRRIYNQLPSKRVLKAMKFRIIHDCTMFLFDRDLSVPESALFTSPRRFWTHCDEHRDDEMWALYSEWNVVDNLEVALTAAFGEDWGGNHSLPYNRDVNVVAWGYRARQFVYEMRILTIAIDAWFERFADRDELGDDKLIS